MTSILETSAYWVTGPGVGELRKVRVPDHPDDGNSLVQAEFGGVSPGTERLVGLGLVAPDCATRMACRYMDGGFELPVKYGYSLVGTCISGALTDRRLFVMHPHQGMAQIEDADAVLLPEDFPAPRATLIPITETALNAVWDASLALGETSVIVGGGPVGLLIAFVLNQLELGPTTIVDVDEQRLRLVESLSFVDNVLPLDELPDESSTVAFHSTGTSAGLQASLGAIGFEGRVIDLSWYGSRPVTLNLGADFHYGRKRILASQVGAIAPSRRDSHTRADRLREVLDLLVDPSVDALLSPPVVFSDLPEFMRGLYAGNSSHPVPLIRYETN
jgi:threonine dehydrogenase-like Zn-dependent dehydrogenase